MPGGAAAAIMAAIRRATATVEVGCPCWSSTTVTVGCSRSSRIMVATKLPPCAP